MVNKCLSEALKPDNFVVDVVGVFVVVVVVALLVVADYIIFSCRQGMLFLGSQRLLLSFCGGVGGVVFTVIFMSNLTTVQC